MHVLDARIEKSPRIASLPRDSRGFPVPYNVLHLEGREPDFTANNSEITEDCMQNGLCSICGGSLGTDVWFVGGPRSAFDPRGSYKDPPVHHECGTFALQVCPYLAVRSYTGIKPAARLRMLEGIVRAGGVLGFVDQTTSPEKPAHFILAKVSLSLIHI